MSASNQISIPSLYAEQRANPWESAVSLECVCECVRVSLCVSQHLLHMCSIHLHVSCLLFVPLSILDAWNDTSSANCGNIEPNLQRWVCLPYFLNKQAQLFFELHCTHVVKKCSPQMLMFRIIDTLYIVHDQLVPLSFITLNPTTHQMLSQSALWFCRMALLCMPITVRIRPYWLGTSLICLLISIEKEIYHIWAVKAEPAALLWLTHRVFPTYCVYFVFCIYHINVIWN